MSEDFPSDNFLWMKYYNVITLSLIKQLLLFFFSSQQWHWAVIVLCKWHNYTVYSHCVVQAIKFKVLCFESPVTAQPPANVINRPLYWAYRCACPPPPALWLPGTLQIKRTSLWTAERKLLRTTPSDDLSHFQFLSSPLSISAATSTLQARAAKLRETLFFFSSLISSSTPAFPLPTESFEKVDIQDASSGILPRSASEQPFFYWDCAPCYWILSLMKSASSSSALILFTVFHTVTHDMLFPPLLTWTTMRVLTHGTHSACLTLITRHH